MGHHCGLYVAVGTHEWSVDRDRTDGVPVGLDRRFGDRSELGYVTFYVDAESRKKLPCDGTGRDAGCRFAGGCTFENVAQVTGLIFLAARKIGVPRPRAFHYPRIFRLCFDLFGRHNIGPMDKIAVLDHQSDRRAKRLSMADAGKYLNGVRLDLHPTAPAVALLPPPKLVVDRGLIDRHPGRHALDDDDKSGTVRFAGGCEFEVHTGVLPRRHRDTEITSAGAAKGPQCSRISKSLPSVSRGLCGQCLFSACEIRSIRYSSESRTRPRSSAAAVSRRGPDFR